MIPHGVWHACPSLILRYLSSLAASTPYPVAEAQRTLSALGYDGPELQPTYEQDGKLVDYLSGLEIARAMVNYYMAGDPIRHRPAIPEVPQWELEYIIESLRKVEQW